MLWRIVPDSLTSQPLLTQPTDAITCTQSETDGTRPRSIQYTRTNALPAPCNAFLGKPPAIGVADRRDREIRSYAIDERWAGGGQAAVVGNQDHAGRSEAVVGQQTLFCRKFDITGQE